MTEPRAVTETLIGGADTDGRKTVSVIIPTLNSLDSISSLIVSIYGQNYRPLEVIIVDGGSIDGTVDAINELAAKLSSESFSIRLLKEKDYGEFHSPANARNIGILNSASDYILFFDADFELTDCSLVLQVRSKLDEHKTAGVKVIPKIDTWLELHCAYDDFRKNLGSNVHSHCGYRREIFNYVMFDPRLGFGEDRDFEKRLDAPPSYLDAYCSRHFIHTFREWRGQAVWYGKTFPRFLRKYWKTLDPREFSVNPLAQLTWRTASLTLLAIALAGMLLGRILSIAALTLLLIVLAYSYASSAKKGCWRIVYLLIREIYYASWFVVGILESIRADG